MGLGKTAQVIAFLANLKEQSHNNKHLIIVPSSTLDNWQREIERFCPSLTTYVYHANQNERFHMREEFPIIDFDIMLTTYNIATGAKEDRSFLRKLKFHTLVLDEGHMIKNITTQRYQHLMALQATFRLLLTGTPLQNNLQELCALLMFIMPTTFVLDEKVLKRIFANRIEVDDDQVIGLPSQERIERAKLMMAPFILRRRKSDVLLELPKKHVQVVSCAMTPTQSELYKEIETRSKDAYRDHKKSVVNIIMELRKAACHPLLHRSHYNEDKLVQMSKDIVKEAEYSDANVDLVYEDMTVMSDFELHKLCSKYKRMRKHCLSDDMIMDCGKVDQLRQILDTAKQHVTRDCVVTQL
jgi:SWI/SNF-related matrix-associated actin-dependent regulator 1 of chromatin subfamily A